MPHIKPRYLNGQRGTGHHGSFDAVADGAVSANDVVIASGYSGDRIKFRQADAGVAGKQAGVMGVADHGAADGERLRVVSHKLVKDVDTDGGTVGYPVYLSETAGGWTKSAVTNGQAVGTLLVAHATTGAVLLGPAHCSFPVDADGVVEP